MIAVMFQQDSDPDHLELWAKVLRGRLLLCCSALVDPYTRLGMHLIFTLFKKVEHMDG